MEPITNEEIEYASKILFENDSTKFYDDIQTKTGERIDVIKCLENKSIVACPGSGKTTALIAKLIILSKRMPFEDGRGICVLTHTNVAIDLIKEKLGIGASRLFSYPNFFGTIQSFIDKFLAAPYCACKYQSRVRHIDNDRVNSDAKIFYHHLRFKKHGGNPLKNSLYRSGTRSNDWDKTRTDEKHENAIKYLSRLVVDYNLQKITDGLGGRTFRNGKSKSETALQDYEDICKYKLKLISKGIISYQDAYSLANSYLNNYPQIANVFQERFRFVFIDEMQDTAIHQSQITNQLFKGSDKTVVQEYGDPNQAIYDYEGQSGEWKPKKEDSLFITESKRFGENIAIVINPLRIQPENYLIKGINGNSLLPPHLILFDEAKTKDYIQVLNKFGELILVNNLHKIKNSKFVAIGRVGKKREDEELTLKSFWKKFEKHSSKSKTYFPTLIEYLRKELPSNKSNYTENIVNAILHILDLHDFRNEITKGKKTIKRRFSKTTFFNYLKKEHEKIYYNLKDKMSDWSLQLKHGNELFNIDVEKDLKKFVAKKILSLKGIELSDSIFFNHPEKINESDDEMGKSERTEKLHNLNENTYFFQYGKEGTKENLPIKINTIHGEKGETHTATLYLETYYNKKYDSQGIKEQLLGVPYQFNHKPEQDMAEKLAYVAMSRAQNLLCLAISSNRISEKYAREKLKPLGWEIITLT
ncbi:UvrD/REP helicase N-terminal domain-containing protein [Tangfeifania diversioriginum]|uniref:DNA 3'-5' helicase II n=1 Tax=Tangfeifania diversioriginum TaxID=1168035 RepID=A0A1M6N0E6_9BACT|nr:UvrD-helicase domain-containing protein [Tangfeifania diversioriginum]SHJ89072.1 UvrD/REP helicase N-terminal domain-containing protein [Tangfeifania diversioriginum]